MQCQLRLGLDPAGPLFEGYHESVRLDKSDAHYVDVIHSNGESLMVGGLGVWEPIGHVDFYPNGGRAQTGCNHMLIGGIKDFTSYISREFNISYVHSRISPKWGFFTSSHNHEHTKSLFLFRFLVP